jgi:cytochrome c-type biogenesis protein CcmH/NrfF
MTRLVAALAAVAALLAGAAPVAAATQPRASLTNIESDVMCVVCKTPLAVSQSAEANRERAFISGLITKGETKAQILKAMVYQYGPAVLALPPAHGFNIALYVLPPAVLIIGAAILLYTLPRWRRRTRAATADTTDARVSTPAPADSRRLEEDLARYGR